MITLWSNDKEISEHLKLEYNQVGCSCKFLIFLKIMHFLKALWKWKNLCNAFKALLI